jgi:hypothetical protein
MMEAVIIIEVFAKLLIGAGIFSLSVLAWVVWSER